MAPRQLGSRQDEAELFSALQLLDGEAFPHEPRNCDWVMRGAFLLQHTPDHFSGRSADREDRERITAQCTHCARDNDAAAPGIVARHHASGMEVPNVMQALLFDLDQGLEPTLAFSYQLERKDGPRLR